jgi:hypothetical protein
MLKKKTMSVTERAWRKLPLGDFANRVRVAIDFDRRKKEPLEQAEAEMLLARVQAVRSALDELLTGLTTIRDAYERGDHWSQVDLGEGL